jgi:hypothetical protein
MSDDLLLHPITISNNSTDTPLIISPTSSLIIPAPSSKNNIIKVHSSTGKPLPEKINSDTSKGKWKHIDCDEALRKLDKIKRKRDEKIPHNSDVLKSNVPKIDYIEEFPEDSSDKQYSDDDIDGDNDEHDINVDDAANTVADPGAFESDAVLPPQNNN